MTGQMLQGLLGIIAFLVLAWAVSSDRKNIPWQTIAVGLLLQVTLAVLFLYFPPIKKLFSGLASGVQLLQNASLEGTSFVFGYLGGGELPFKPDGPGSAFVFGIQSLPVILMIGALSALFWHWRILMVLVRAAAWCVNKTLNVSGAVGVSSAANIFMGMVEAPLLVKPYIPKLSKSELFAVMAGGLSTIAGSTMIVIGSIIDGAVPNAFGHLLAGSVINAPAAIMFAKIMQPGPQTFEAKVELESEYSSSLDAVTRGTSDAVKLLANVIGMLIVFVALIALIDNILSALHPTGNLTLAGILGPLLSPVAWLMGIPWSEATDVGSLLGLKVVASELLAYIELVNIQGETLSAHSYLIMTYALCSFSNFASLAIMIGGLTAMAPERTKDIVSLGPKAILAGFLASASTATIVGVITIPAYY